jgi:hypothetical protein
MSFLHAVTAKTLLISAGSVDSVYMLYFRLRGLTCVVDACITVWTERGWPMQDKSFGLEERLRALTDKVISQL